MRITESPISLDVEIGSQTFCPDQQDFWTIGARINKSLLYMYHSYKHYYRGRQEFFPHIHTSV